MEILSMCVNIIAHGHTAGNQIINPAPRRVFFALLFQQLHRQLHNLNLVNIPLVQTL